MSEPGIKLRLDELLNEPVKVNWQAACRAHDFTKPPIKQHNLMQLGFSRASQDQVSP